MSKLSRLTFLKAIFRKSDIKDHKTVEEEHDQKQEQINRTHLGGENLGILLYLPQKS